MEPRNRTSFVLVVLLCFLYMYLGTTEDTITASRPIRNSETIISKGSVFRLGFFSPSNSLNRYVGIWYNGLSKAYVWVANRDKPLKDSSGVVTIQEGNLVVVNGQNHVLWSSKVSNSINNVSAQLLDSGNLVLKDDDSGRILWDSFHEPSDSLLAGMPLISSKSTGPITRLTSWKNPSDPSPGNFSLGINPSEYPETFIWNNARPYWRSGPWNGQVFLGIAEMISYNQEIYKISLDDQSVLVNYSYLVKINISTFFILTSEGIAKRIDWNNENKTWMTHEIAQHSECDIYGLCGEFGNCNPEKRPVCSCLKGFKPKDVREWNKGNWTSGCVRKRLLQCDRINQTGEVITADRFVKLDMIKLPDFVERSSVTLGECREQCLNNCSCIAYATDHGTGCMTWTGKLYDLQKFSFGGADLYIRLVHSEFDRQDNKVVVIIASVVGLITFAICIALSLCWIAKEKGRRKGLVNEARSNQTLNRVMLQDLPIFSFEKLAIATNNFHLTNKLGQGGFGQVFRGELEDGQEIAVKRLSNVTGQGLQEFTNEVMVISKLQHRNLVRLLGCCIDKEEKMLIYEYMPNKSLDAFLFDPLKQNILDWRKRFNIIEGIGRGLLYLHKDSRLKIIHRDLKPSNILLDEELNPKISDFGMARIFGGNEDQVNTIRVVGTYGYMSPEYVMEGCFSEKSDVFSYGVLLLEIISGRRNTSFYRDAQSLSLLGYVWKLWNENNVAAVIHPVISDPCHQSEIIRCIHLGLLCVQEFVRDRPNMSTVVSVLMSEIVDLPAPRQPAFTERRQTLDQSSAQIQKKCSTSYVTVTDLHGTAEDTITASRPIRDPEAIISKGSIFRLGFFSPGNSSNRYLGIWYNGLPEAYIWVANRNKPLNNSSGVVTVQNGNLVVINGQNQVLWSSNVSASVTNASAQLLDSGNLVLKDDDSGRSLWDSFHELTDSLLVGAQLISSKSTGPILKLTPWKSPSDPSPGSFSSGINHWDIPEGFIWDGSHPYWRSGPFHVQVYLGIPGMYSYYQDKFKISVDDQTGLLNFCYSVIKNVPTFFILTHGGSWNEESGMMRRKHGMLIIKPGILSVIFMASVENSEIVIHKKGQYAAV